MFRLSLSVDCIWHSQILVDELAHDLLFLEYDSLASVRHAWCLVATIELIDQEFILLLKRRVHIACSKFHLV